MNNEAKCDLDSCTKKLPTHLFTIGRSGGESDLQFCSGRCQLQYWQELQAQRQTKSA